MARRKDAVRATRRPRRAARRLGITAAAAAIVIALAAAAAASPAIWDGGTAAAPLPHLDRRPSAADIFSQPLHLAQPLLPQAHADPHYWPCNYIPRAPTTQIPPTLTFDTPDGVYGIGADIIIRAHSQDGFANPTNVHDHTRLALETGDVDRFALWHATNSHWTTVLYKYTVQPGDYSPDLDYKASNALHYGTGPGSNYAGSVNCWLSTPGTNDYHRIWANQQSGQGAPSLAVNRNIIIDGIIPRVENVTMASGAYGAGSQENVTVNFGEPIFLSGPPPSLILALDGENRAIPYLDGNETASLIFNYTVRQGDLADDLEYAGTDALVLAAGGGLEDLAGNNASLALPAPGAPGSLGATSDASITAAPGAVAGVDSPLPDGAYPAGYRVEVAVSFSEPVVYSGAPPSLVLNFSGANRTASYASGNNTRSLAFNYTVQPGDPAVASLDYAGAGALLASGGLSDRAGDAVATSLPVQGGDGLLGRMRSIAIEPSAAAYVAGVDSPGGDTAYRSNSSVAIAVTFSDPVDVTGNPVLALATEPPRSASYSGGSGARTLEFRYAVEAGDKAADLDYAGVAALSLEGGAEIRHAVQGGAGALLALPAPGGPGSLGHARDIAIDGAAPSVANVTSPSPDGTYGTGRVVNITVAFDEAVAVEGEPLLAASSEVPRSAIRCVQGLEQGPCALAPPAEPPRGAAYARSIGASGLAFAYAVQPGVSVAGPGNAGDSALVLGSGGGAAIRDMLGNTLGGTLALPAPEGIDVHGHPVPVLAPAGWAADGQGSPRFDRLGGAHDMAAFELGENGTFAVVASTGDDAVQLIQVRGNGTLRAVSTLNNTGDLELNGAIAVDTIDMGENGTFAVVASIEDDGVQLIRIHGNGTMEPAHRLVEGGARELDASRSIDAFWTAGGRAFALVASVADHGVQLVRIHGNGMLEAAGTLDVADNPALRGAGGVSAFRAANGTTMALVASYLYGGVQLVQVDEEAGTLSAVGSASSSDPGLARLARALYVTAMAPDGENGTGSTLAMVTPYDRSHAQMVRVYDNGTIKGVGSAADGRDGFTNLGRPQASDFFTMGGRTYAVAASQSDDGVQLMRVHSDGALEAVSSAADGRDGFSHLGGAHGIDAFVESAGNRTFALVASLTDGAVQLIRLSPATVTGVDIAPPGVTYPLGHQFKIAVAFDAPVDVSGPPPSLLLALDGRNVEADYLSGSGTASLVFNYTVQPGDSADHLGHAGPGALVARGAVTDVPARGIPALRPPAPGDVVEDLIDGGQPHLTESGTQNLQVDPILRHGATSADADLELPAPDDPESLGPLQRIAVDGSAVVYVTGVSSPNASGAYGRGYIDITVQFSARVDVEGAPVLRLNTSPPRDAGYAGGGGTGELTFRYGVEPGDTAADLDYRDEAALSLGSGGTASIRASPGGTDAILALPAPGADGSLGHSKDIVIDTARPNAVRVDSPDPDGTYGTGRIVNITVSFDEAVYVEGIPAIRLATVPERNATYASGGGTNMLSFLYTVQPGDSADALDHAPAAAAAPPVAGAAIRDLAGNPAANPLSLPDPGTGGSLLDSKDINVHGARLPVLAAAGHAGDGQGDPAFEELGGADRVAAFAMGNDTFALVASEADDGIELIRILENGTLRHADSIDNADGSNLKLNGARSVDTILLPNGTVLAVVASHVDDGVALIQVLEDGTLRHADSIDKNDGGGLNLDGARSIDAFWTADNATAFAIVASYASDGVQLVRIDHENVTLEPAGKLDNAAGRELNGAGGVAAFRTADGTTMALVASFEDSGIQLVRVDEDSGSLAAVRSAKNTDAGLGRLHRAIFVTAMESYGGAGASDSDRDNSTLAMVSPFDQSHVQLVRVYDNGTIEAEGSAADTLGGFDALGGARASDFFTMDGRTYAVVASHGDRAVQMIRVHDDGTLEAAGSAADGQGGPDGFVELNGAHGIDAFEMNNRAYAIVASVADSGVQLIRLTPPSVESVTASLPYGGTLVAGAALNVTVAFDEPVSVSGPAPSLLLNLGGGRVGAAEYLDGGGTTRLVFNYTVRQGDNAGRLEYAGPAALTTRGIIVDARGAVGAAAADLELPAPGGGGSLAASAPGTRIDAVGPRVAGVGDAEPKGAAYVEGDTVRIAVLLDDAAVTTSPSPQSQRPSLRLALEEGAVATAVFERQIDADGRTTLVFNYTVEDGDLADPLDYDGPDALLAGDWTIRDGPGNDADLRLPFADGRGLLAASAPVIRIDTVEPRVLSVSSQNASGTYGIGSQIRIDVAFDEEVLVTGEPRIALETGETDRHAAYDGGSGSRILSFVYTALTNDFADPLNYANRTALSLNGGTIKDRAGNDAVLGLPAADSPRSLAGQRSIAIDAAPDLDEPARVVAVLSSDAGGTYGAGSAIDITAAFSRAVFVEGTPLLWLSTAPPRSAEYVAGSDGDSEIAFRYVVGDGDRADPLNYANRSALSLNGGTIRDADGGDANLTLPPTESTSSLLGAGISIAADAAAPRVLSVTSPNASETYGIGSQIRIDVAFDEEVLVTGEPRIALETGETDRHAAYDGGSGSRILSFVYTALTNDFADPLNYANRTALSLNGGTIKDRAGNDAVLGLPAADSPRSLAGQRSIAIDAAPDLDEPARVVAVLSSDAGGTYGAGSAIDITAAFSRAVFVEGTPLLWLSTAPPRSAEYVAGSDGDSEIAFRYVVGDGDRADPLNYANRSALSLNGGTIRDADGGDANLTLPPTESTSSLLGAGIAVGAGTRGGGNSITVVFGPDGAGNRANLADRGDDLRVTIDVSGLAGAGAGGTVTFPRDGAAVTTSFASVSFPPGVVAESVPADGRLALHIVAAAGGGLPSITAVQEALAYGGSGAVLLQRVVEMGDEDARIKFDRPVRISLDGLGGGRAFYIDGGSSAGGSIMAIDAACAADDTDRVERQLGGEGECRVDSGGEGGDLVVYTYHLTRFGAVLSERGTPPPVLHTCSLRLASPGLAVQASPGAYSEAVRQAVVNSGSETFARVALDATPWRVGYAAGQQGPGAPPLPASLTVLSTDGQGGEFAPLSAAGGGAASVVARSLAGGLEAPLWLKINLTGHDRVQGTELIQRITYVAECGGLSGR